MGLLTTGRPLLWNEIVQLRDVLRSYALKQLVRVFEKCKDRCGDSFMWGDEVELTLVRFDHASQTVQLLLKADQLLPRLVDFNENITDQACRIAWHPEACNFVVEGVPSAPYGFLPSHLNIIEANMKLRREQVQRFLSEQSDSEYVLNLAVFPRYSQGEFVYPWVPFDHTKMIERSLCFPDSIISPIHPRTKSLTENTNARRQSKASINIPIFRDTQTPQPFRDQLFEDEANLIDDHIHLDSSLSGWGCCCLQVTFQSQSLAESLRLFDQLLPLTGIMLALSAACPIWRGYLSDVDCRWNVLSEAADDRTSEERQQSAVISRYNSTPFYLCEEHEHLNDTQLMINNEVVSTLVSHGISPTLAHHFGHLFSYDPLVILEEQVHWKDETSSYHFENLNSLVWHSLRFKPPPLDDDQMGWRVEFRPMDIQITDFENASLVVFIALLTRVILTYNLDLSIPISQIKENMDRAHHRDSVRKEKFYFRVASEIRMMSMNEIINGTGDFSGLVPLIRTYLEEREEIDADTRLSVQHYLSLISKRAAGTLLTDASWIRDFVLSHSEYQHDSVVSDQIQYDLLWKITQIANGHQSCPSIVQSQMQTHTDLHSS